MRYWILLLSFLVASCGLFRKQEYPCLESKLVNYWDLNDKIELTMNYNCSFIVKTSECSESGPFTDPEIKQKLKECRCEHKTKE